jgi:hypothetical protein
MNGMKPFIALAVSTTVAILGTASAALAKGNMHPGGNVRPCSLDGVNPAYHPYIFGNPAATYAVYGFVRSRDGTWQVVPNCHR